VHGRVDLLWALLRALGALDPREYRRRDFWIVQVGDLLDRRASRNDNLEVARLAVESLDVVLAGNHEVEMLSEAQTGHGGALSTLASRGWPHAAAALSGWLVTHAGVHPELTHGLPRRTEECVVEINDRWHRRSRDASCDPLFDWVGPAKGGIAPYGGLFWRADSEWPPGGRTPWGLIDVGANGSRLAALVRRDSAAKWSPWVVRLTHGRAEVARRPSERAPLAA
jgi:hypothetical protein